MGKKLLLVSQGSTFMVDAIAKNLAGVGFQVTKAAPEVKELKDGVEGCDIILLYLGDYIEEAKEGIIYLTDACIAAEKNLNVIGDSMELADLKQFVPEKLIANIFSRPLDIKKLVEVMDEEGKQVDSDEGKYSILLVDDDPTYLKMVKSWLANDYRVTIVTSGMQALTYIAKNTPDLILLDYEMPVTPGPKVLEMIRSEASTAEIPVIFLTGKDDKESVEKVISLRPQGYIIKTLAKTKLLEQVGNFFENRKANKY